MHRIYFYKLGLLLFGGGMIATGIMILLQGEVLLQPATLIGGTVIVVHGGHMLVNYFFNRNTTGRVVTRTALFAGVGNMLAGALIILLPNITITLLLILFTFYVLLNGASKFTDYLIYRKNHVSGRLYDLGASLFFFTFCIIVIFIPNMGTKSLLVVSGVYCIVYGAYQINDFILQVIPQRAKNSMKRHIRISAPVFLSTFMPIRFLRDFNKLTEVKEPSSDENFKELIVKTPEDKEPPDIEVLIHVSDDGVGVMGHCDLYIDGQVLSYGNYDETSMRLCGCIGDGVFFTARKERYIRFSVTHDKKIIFCYGLRLTKEQMRGIRAEVARIRSNVYRWKPPYQLELEKNKKALIDKTSTDYCSKLWNGTRAHFYKFRSGRFKTYFILSTNCVLLADSILGKAGTDIVKLNGIITPGSYFDFMQREFLIDGSMVISRKIYTKDNTSELKKRYGF